MHWFLWLLFALNVCRAVGLLAVHGKPITERRYDTAAGGMVALCLATAILVYGGII